LELNKILNSTYQPVTKWGEVDGKPTTIREVFAKKATDYWLKKVDSNGKESDGWSAKMTRAEYVAQNHLEQAFKEVLSSELEVVVKSFKASLAASLTSDAKKQIEGSLSRLIRTK
jgi:hypothetical protein